MKKYAIIRKKTNYWAGTIHPQNYGNNEFATTKERLIENLKKFHNITDIREE